MTARILSAARLVLSIGAFMFVGAPSASAQEVGASLQLAGIPPTLTVPGGFSMTVSGSTGTASRALIYPIYGPAPCSPTVEAQLEAGPDEVLASPPANELPPLGFAGTFSVQVPVGQPMGSSGLYTICVFMEAPEDSEAVEPSQEGSLIAVASASFTVLPTLSPTSPTAVAPGGGRKCVVPHVKGKRLGFAEKAIASAHCALGRIRRAASLRVKKGHVIWQSRRPGTSLPAGARVGLVVGKG
jgi:hypothetical protein